MHVVHFRCHHFIKTWFHTVLRLESVSPGGSGVTDVGRKLSHADEFMSFGPG